MTPEPAFGFAEVPAVAEQRTIPFDYAFRFELTGTPGKTLRRTITVSTEAAFTAVSLGYGVISAVERLRFGLNPVNFPPAPPALARIPTTLAGIALSDLIADLDRQVPAERDVVLRSGFRLSPEVARLPLAANLSTQLLSQAFEAIGAPAEQIQFTYALFDDGSGREFQSDPILNTAGLGTANGERPFRHLATPIRFEPLAVIRMEVTELSTIPGELHVSLQGYKMLGGQGTPTGRRLGRPRRPGRR